LLAFITVTEAILPSISEAIKKRRLPYNREVLIKLSDIVKRRSHASIAKNS